MSLFSLFRRNDSKPESVRRRTTSHAYPAGLNDPQLPEKKRARRRLVGAVVLIVLSVALLPLVFESKPQQQTRDIHIEVQGESTQAAQINQDIQQPTPVSASSETENVEEPVATEQQNANTQVAEQTPEQAPADTPTTNTQVAVNTSANKPVNTVADNDARVATEERRAREEKIRNEQLEKERKARQEKLEKEKQAKAEKQKKAVDNDPIGRMIADKSGSSNSGARVAQIAAMSTQDKANELQARLSRSGVRANVQKIRQGGADHFRVRIGPYANHAELEKACAKVRSAGLSCTMVN